ncbi:Crp/Fnr family transcriptional regulator [Pelistega europaea]|uniref:Crp/Fnr family transcriptional regulator n=1 Tax=Pelistega europaea TaxID=106147 RepID=A0A7Y4LA60_9BURK|nr:Crp/Fnr family transcriptional regulator [Pelistega europaea]NOL49749.1 Crp/Fnr family transcriptional regulator [Pelistega europaea]
MININSLSVEDRQALRHMLEQHPLFHQYPEAFYDVLMNNAGILKVKAGQLVFREGDDAPCFMVVRDGAIEMFRYSIEGDERVFSIFERGQLVAHAAMFMPHGKYPMNARVRDDAVLFCIQRQALHQACMQFPLLAIRLLGGFSMQIYQHINQVHWLTSSSAQERLAHYFVELSQSQQSDIITLPVTQKQLAAQLGIRAETLNRLLGEWQQKNYIQGKRKEWQLLDVTYLKSLSGAAKRTF